MSPMRFAKKILSLAAISPHLRLTEEEIIALVQGLPTKESLIFTSRLDLALYHNRITDLYFQFQLVDRFYDQDRATVLKRLITDDGFGIFVHHQQIYRLQILLIEHGSTQDRALSENDAFTLTKLLLAVNDLIEDSDSPIDESVLPGYMWQKIGFVQEINRNFGSEIARHSLVFQRRSRVVDSLFRKATGAGLLEFWAIGYLLWGKFMGVGDELPPPAAGVDKHAYFMKCKGLSPSAISAFFQHVARDTFSLRSELLQSMSAFGRTPTNFLAIKRRPLLDIGDGKFVPLSIPYFVHRITRGIVDLMDELLVDGDDKELFGSELSSAYEHYGIELLSSALDNPFTKRVFHGHSKRIEIADAVVDYGSKVIFTEIKALTIRHKPKLSREWSTIEDGIIDFLTRRGCKQLHKRIKQYKSGAIRISEIPREQIKRYYPVLVSCVDSLPQTLLLTGQYMKVLADNSILQDMDVATPTFLDIEDLEALCTLVGEHGILDLIEERLFDIALKDYDMGNYLLDKVRPERRHPQLDAELNRLTDEIKRQISL